IHSGPIAVGPIVPLMKLMCCNKDVVENSFLFQKINSHRNPAHQATITIFSLLLSIRRRFSPE
ncbi:hypothetical protein, partial [Salmonella enterica]|uniref:hypothetical protein n=1 Tax=Salmonella enterica TaxID=28901 RepID=UPI001C4DF0F8